MELLSSGAGGGAGSGKEKVRGSINTTESILSFSRFS